MRAVPSRLWQDFNGGQGLTEVAEETLAELMQASVLVCCPLVHELQGLVSQKNAAHGLALHLLAKLGLLRLLQLSCICSQHTLRF